MNPYRSVRVIADPTPRWWKVAPSIFWAYPVNVAFSLAGIAYHAATFDLHHLLFHLVFLAIHASIVVLYVWFGRRYWRRYVAPKLSPRSWVVPAGGAP